jgi:hypothetical protein
VQVKTSNAGVYTSPPGKVIDFCQDGDPAGPELLLSIARSFSDDCVLPRGLPEPGKQGAGCKDHHMTPSAVTVGVTLEALFLTGFGQPDPPPAYIGPAVVNWVWLAESAGFAAAGAAMIAILTGAERSARRQPAGSLPG